mmetsp:Transcript_9940/g.16650  ORF Transcript_9940/g.16650 Transcript_9940/m.16650 type:complete len:213 (+) Transcript_9940:58-696(+)
MSDSDDDLPISELIKKRKRMEAAKLAAAKKPVTVKKEKDSSAGASRNNAVSSRVSQSGRTHSSASSSSSSSGGNKSADFYLDSHKGLLVQRFLCRWWYAMKWPDMDSIGAPPAGYESLEGFPGVFISTKVDSLGHILDLRDKETCPCLSNVCKWPSEQIKAMCIKAYDEQMKQLQAAEGDECKLMRELKKELQEIRAVDPSSADRKASRYSF